MNNLKQFPGFKPSKAMGQNFLIDENIAAKIVKLSGADKSCGVLEAGPGFGALTSLLAQRAGHVTAVELDKRLAGLLQQNFSAYPNVTIVTGDILKTDIAALVSETMPAQRVIACSNLPYNITTPCIASLIQPGVFSDITVMVQKEVARRMCALPGTPDYGAFTVFINYHTTPEIGFDVSPPSFMPRPKVTSSVVRLSARREPLLDKETEKMFFRIVKAAFAQRRKTLANALHAGFSSSHGKEDITGIITDCGFDAAVRGETLSIGDFVTICNKLLTFV